MASRVSPSIGRRLSRASCAALGKVLSATAGTALLLTGFAPQASAQERRQEQATRDQQVDQSFRVRIDPSLSTAERTYVDVGGSASFGFFQINDPGDTSRRLVQPEFTLYGRFVFDQAHTFFARTRFQYRAFSEGDSFDNRGDGWQEPFLDRYWYEFDSAALAQAQTGEKPTGGLRLRAGRQFVDWGAGLTLSEQLIAATFDIYDGPVKFTGLVGVTPTDEGVTDFDASRNQFDTNTERAFYGGMLSFDTREGQSLYAYVLRMQDQNGRDTPRNPVFLPPSTLIDASYSATYFGLGTRGSISNNITFEGEVVFQSGSSMSDPLFPPTGFPAGTQTQEDVSAWAARAQLEWFLRDENRTKLTFEAILASGDDDRLSTTDTMLGNRTGTDDNAFNSMGFANTGLAFSPSLSNIIALRAGVTTFPFAGSELLDQLQLGADVIFTSKLNADGQIDELTTPGDAYLGIETDVYANWRVTSDLAISLRYGVFFPGDAFASGEDNRHFLFMGTTLAF